MVTAKELRCLKCLALIRITEGEGPLMACSVCGSRLEVYLCPAFFRSDETIQAGQRLVADSEASCFSHPSKQAEVVCQHCGRFLCGLCATEMDEQPICLGCLTEKHKQGDDRRLENRRILYDDIALTLAVVPLLMWFITFITAPTVIFLVLWKWRKGSTSLIPRTRIRYVLAFILALLQFSGWTYFITKAFI